MLELDSYPTKRENVVVRIVNEEAVLVLPEQGKVKVLNEVGARIWIFIDGNHSIRQIISGISDEYQVDQNQAESDVMDFLVSLEERGLIAYAHSSNQG